MRIRPSYCVLLSLYAIIPISLSFGIVIYGIFTLMLIITICRICERCDERLFWMMVRHVWRFICSDMVLPRITVDRGMMHTEY